MCNKSHTVPSVFCYLYYTVTSFEARFGKGLTLADFLFDDPHLDSPNHQLDYTVPQYVCTNITESLVQ